MVENNYKIVIALARSVWMAGYILQATYWNFPTEMFSMGTLALLAALETALEIVAFFPEFKRAARNWKIYVPVLVVVFVDEHGFGFLSKVLFLIGTLQLLLWLFVSTER